MTASPDRAGGRDGESGLASLWLLLVLPLMFVLGSLSLAVFSAYAEWRVIAEVSESGARAGANGIDLDEFDQTGIVQLDPDTARRLAIENIQAQDPNPYVTYSGATADTETVTVEIRATVPMRVFGIITIKTVEISAASEAEPRVQR